MFPFISKFFNFVAKVVQRSANNREIKKGRKRTEKHGNNMIFNQIEGISFYYNCVYILSDLSCMHILSNISRP